MTRDRQHPPLPPPTTRATQTTQGSETLLDVLNAAADGGYGAQFVALDDGLIQCVQCASTNRPASFDIVHFRRLEGASDPADMLIVVWSVCPSCQAHGTLTLGFGPNASGADATVLALLDLHGTDASPRAPQVSPPPPT